MLQVCILYSAGAASPVGVWPLDSITRWRDVSGNENHATGTNMTFADGPGDVANSAFELKMGKFLIIKKTDGPRSLDVRRSFSLMFHLYSMDSYGSFTFSWRTAGSRYYGSMLGVSMGKVSRFT
jgi:hypothetical protein